MFESFLVHLESNHFYSSYGVKLPTAQWILSLFWRNYRGEHTLLAGLGFQEHLSIPRIRTRELCTRSCARSKLLSLFSSMLRVHSIDFPPVLESLDFADSEIRPGWFQVYVPFSFSERTFLREDEWSLSRYWVLSSDCTCHNCIWRSSFDGLWIASVADFFLKKFNCVFVRALVSGFACGWRLEICTLGNMTLISWFFNISLFLTDFYQ